MENLVVDFSEFKDGCIVGTVCIRHKEFESTGLYSISRSILKHIQLVYSQYKLFGEFEVYDIGQVSPCGNTVNFKVPAVLKTEEGLEQEQIWYFVNRLDKL